VLPPTVLLYGRPDCHLCDEARAGLERMRSQGARFELREIDIESDDELFKRYLERIPVIEIDGAEVCDLGLDPGAVKTRLATLSG
jgi:glutaredoxin